MVERGFDYIFIDVGPSSGALTRACFLSCDCFFLPVAPDRFSVQAIGTVSTIVERWMREHREIYDDYRSIGLPVRPGLPVFLGAIVQAFKLYRGRAKKAYQLWIDEIPERIGECLIPALETAAGGTGALVRCGNPPDYLAAQIPDFSTLAPLGQRLGKAVFAITQQDTRLATEDGQPWKGKTWREAAARMHEYRDSFERLASRLEAGSE